MRILGLSAFYHDSAAALVEDGAIVAAAQEERFSRKKQDSGFPAHAIDYCLEAGRTTSTHSRAAIRSPIEMSIGFDLGMLPPPPQTVTTPLSK